MKKFKTTGPCIPEKNYMVNIDERLKQLKSMVEQGDYFTINRGRQYGKTTTLILLRKYLEPEYTVVSLDFQGISSEGFRTEQVFVSSFCGLMIEMDEYDNFLTDDIRSKFHEYYSQDSGNAGLEELFRTFRVWCKESEKPITLIIDEVDSASNNQVFLDFLAQFRMRYIKRDSSGIPAFQSVILAGVTDIKHLKSKIRDDSQHKVNSPWNIAVDFTMDMSLSEEGIRGMLDEYEADHSTGMDTAAIAKELRNYTGGYPFLMSRLCQIIDEQLVPDVFENKSEAWTEQGIEEAVKMLLSERNTLFESLSGKLVNYPEIKKSLKKLLMEGEDLAYNPFNESIVQMEMYGFIKRNNKTNKAEISNRIFETLLYDLFMSEEELKGNEFTREGSFAKNIFVKDGYLDMKLVLERFIETYTQICGPLTERFGEKDGRELFLLYLRPIINGTGNYYIEAQTRDQRRTDVIVDYLGRQYIVELKIWHGERYNAEGEKQISGYLDYFGINTGYMLSFNFNKEKEQGVKEIRIGDKLLIEGML